MVGFISGDPVGSQAVQALGLDAVPSSVGDAAGAEFSEGFNQSLGPRIGRSLMRAGVNPMDPEGIGSGLGEMAGTGANEQPNMNSPALTPDQANAKWGIPGVLKFDQPVSDYAAKDVHDAKHAEALRADTMNRSNPSFAVRTLAGLAGGLMDPTNLALGLVPGVGEAAVADALGGGTLARLAGRAVQGATAGAAGMAAAEPVNYLLDQQEHTDWTLKGALQNVAFGGLLGGGLHTALGGFAERPGRAVSDRIEAAGPEARENLLQGSVGQLMDDKPVMAGRALDAVDADRALGEMQSWRAQQERINTDSDAALQAASLPGAPDMTAQIGAASDRLDALRSTADGFRADAARAGEDATRAAMDPATADRLASVEQELSGAIPSARRARLEDERTMLLDGQPATGDLDVARAQSEQQGLQVAGARAQAAADKAETALQKLRDQDAAARGTAADAQGAADQAFGIQAARLTSKEQVVQDLAARTLRRLAGRAGVVLGEGEADTLAQQVLRRGLDPAEAVGRIADRGSDPARITPDTLAGNLPPADPRVSAGDPAAALQTTRASAVSDLQAAAVAPDKERAAISSKADAAAARGPGTLADLQGQIADLEGARRPPPDPNAPEGQAPGSGDPTIDAAQEGMDKAEQRASAVQQAAACLLRSGI